MSILSQPDGSAPSSTPLFQARYRFTITEYRAFHAVLQDLQLMNRIFWRWRFGWVPGSVALMAGYIFGSRGLDWDKILSFPIASAVALVLTGAFAFVLLIDFLVYRVYPAWVFKRFAIANLFLTFAASEDALAWSSDGMEGQLSWDRITRIVEGRDHVFLFISKLEAFVFPRHAFNSAQEFEAFTRFAKEKVHA